MAAQTTVGVQEPLLLRTKLHIPAVRSELVARPRLIERLDAGLWHGNGPARKLYVALNTVKVHTRNIYGKLGVYNRTQAAAKARSLGLLPPT